MNQFYQKKRLEKLHKIKIVITKQLALKDVPSLQIIHKILFNYNRPLVEVDFSKNNFIILTHSKYDVFYLAYALYKLYLRENKMSDYMSYMGIENCCLAFALAFCESFNSYSDKLSVDIPSHMIEKVLVKNRHSGLDTTGIPINIRASADEFKDRYKMVKQV